MITITSNLNRVTTRHSDVVCVSPYQMRIFELLGMGTCDFFDQGQDVMLRPEGVPSITLTVYTETFNDLVARGLIERFSNSARLADGIYLAS